MTVSRDRAREILTDHLVCGDINESWNAKYNHFSPRKIEEILSDLYDSEPAGE